MNRLIAAFLSSVLLLTGCTAGANNADERSEANAENMQGAATGPSSLNIDVDINDLDDPKFLQYVEDAVYASTEEDLSSDDYVIESVVASHVSKEYLEELDYNSQENIYFGYTLSEIEAQFDGAQYVFTLDENGETEAQSFAPYDDTFDQVLKNVAVGSGVILVSVTVSIVAGTIAAPTATAISTVFAASAVAGTVSAIGSGAIGAIVAGAVTGFQTGDVEASLKSAALAGSEGFKWGAITGAVVGGATSALSLHRAAASVIRTPRESEIIALKKLGGIEQKSYLAGKEVPYGTAGSTRPDIVRIINGRLEAIEVKNYDLKNSLQPLATELKRQVSQRLIDLPPGSTQRIVIDAKGRGYSRKFIKEVREYLASELDPIYLKIPIEILS